MRIAAVQHDIVWCDRAANVAAHRRRLAGAVDAGAEVVLFSETFTTGFATDRPDLGEPPDGPSATFLVESAADHGVWVGGTYAELSEDGGDADDRRPTNTFLLAGPHGETHRYAKRYTFGFGGEDRYLRAGDDRVTVEVGGLRVTMVVCYDLRFAPEFWDAAARTDCYLVPANWPRARRLHWQTLLRARAIENQAWVVGVNRVGRGGPIDYVGDTAVIDPLGETVAAVADDTDGIVVVDVTAARVAEVRAAYPFIDDRR